MRVRATLAAAGLVAAAFAVTAPSASAYCDPKYFPLCTNDCNMYAVNHPKETVKDPMGSLIRVCPH